MKKLLLCAVASVLGITAMNGQVNVKDPATYTPVDGYELRNLWIRSIHTNNDPSVELGEARGMAVLDGQMLFCKRGGDPMVASIDIYDGATGAFVKNVPLAANIFEGFAYPCNDIQVDAAGNVLVANLTLNIVTSSFQVWKIDLNDGSGVKVLDCTLSELEAGESTPVVRIDAFGVYGDVMNDGYLMAAVSGNDSGTGDQVLRWDIKGGVVSAETQFIGIQSYYPATVIANGTAPRVCPVDENLFYLDGFTAAAALYDMEGVLVDSFEKAIALAPESVGNNGVDEFSIDGKDFIVYIYSNNEGNKRGNPDQAWNVCEMGPNMAFEGMKKYFTFPEKGLGTASNAVRTGLPRIEVVNGNVALLYVYAYRSGFAAYMFGTAAALDSYLSVDGVDADKFAIHTTAEGISISEAANVEVYDFTGQQITVQGNATTVALAPGNYIVKAVSATGTVVSKVIVK